MTAADTNEELSPIKRALLEIRELRTRLAAAESAAHEPVAIVGAGLRFPGGVRDLDGLWELLAAGRDAVTEIPSDRWDIDALYDADPDAPGRMFTRHGGFIDEVDRFDAEFFGISPREAESMDPQQRVLLETAWHAFEDAGIAPTDLHGSNTGVFLGVCNNDYGRMLFAHRERIDPYFSPGNAGSVVSGRLSYFLGAHGPSVTIDTACSSSLVALHYAVQSLRSGECDLAIAGGINLILSPEININFSKARMMAPDGRCKTFDAHADGYVRGEGCGLVVLRRLRDCTGTDRVMAVVRGSAINQDGRSGGLTAPNGPAQEAVIRAALQAARVEPSSIGYVEAHGTGTSLGDPIEVQALGAALCQGRPAAQPLAIGSIKTNIGHLEAAAGVAGLLKVVLALQHRQIPPHLHFRERNPHIDWDALALEVPTAMRPWEAIGGRRLAGVSSFGFSGTNAHVVLEEPPVAAPLAEPAAPPRHVLALSARQPHLLSQLCAGFAAHLHDSKDALADVCATANAGRTHFAHRVAVRGEDAQALSTALLAAARRESAAGLVAGTAVAAPRIAFLFTGGGAQTVGMAQGLYARSAIFRRALDEAAAVLDPMIGRPLLEVLNAAGAEDAPIHQTRFGQPALVAVEIALAALWRSWGIVPSAVLGHSLGEYAAAHVAGVLSLEDALRIVVERTRLVDTLRQPGAMATMFASAAEVERVIAQCGGSACIAAFNGPEQVVVSGPAAAVGEVAAHFEARGTRVSRLRVAYASHSSMMDPLLEPFERALAGVRFGEPQLTFVSNLSGAVAGKELIGAPSYWSRHLRQPVRFEQSVRALRDAGIDHFLEIGPHPVLVGMGAACVPEGGVWLPSLRRDHDDWDVIVDSLQALYVAGAPVDWAGFDGHAVRRRVALPAYPFDRKRHWADWARRTPVSATPSAAAWQAVAGALGRQSDRGPLGLDLTGYDRKWASLERLTVAHAARVLREAGAFRVAGERATAEELRARLDIPASYRHLLVRWLERLADAGALRTEGPVFVCDRALPEPDIAACWADAEATLGDNRPLLDYVRHCGELLPAVLRGEQSPLETLFPGGSFDLADGLYRRSATMRYINELAASATHAFVAAQGTRPLRVLEIGAGTGGTTAALLPCFAPGRTRYRFTDVSPFFFDRARDEFGPCGFVEFGELDVDRELAEQGVAAGGFDLVIASNAVHASRDLRAAMRRLRELVAPGGMLLLVESTAHLAWFDMTTGLIEGWQHFADDLRTDNPLLPASTWVSALREAGFDDADAWPRAGTEASRIGQHVVVARVAGEHHAAPPEIPSPAAAGTVLPVAGPAAVDDAQAERRRIADALPGERHDLLRDFVRSRVVRVLKLDPAHPPGPADRLMDLGFDSLMAVQLRNQLGTGLKLDKPLPATVMFDHPTIDALASYLLERIAPPATPAVAADRVARPAAPSPNALGAEAVAAMSDADIEALLVARLEPR